MSKNIYVYCEGQTEEAFVNRVLAPYLLPHSLYCSPIICTTGTRNHGQRKFKGGATSYGRIKHELTLLCKQHPHEWVTTLFDYYGMPADTPEMQNSQEELYPSIQHIERSIQQDIGVYNLIFHFNVHEFEALLFSEPEAFELIADQEVVENIKAVRKAFQTPEHINNSYETAPSKRLLSIIPSYAKVRHGAELSELIGIERVRRECPHFDRWIRQLIELST